MTARIDKEFRTLFWPWVFAALAAFLPWLNQSLKGFDILELRDGLTVTGMLIYFFFVILCGALPFGIEFHHRTMPLLLSQPCSRRRLWREKVSVSMLMLITMAVAHILGLQHGYSSLTRDLLAPTVMTLLLFSSSMCWTLASRTTVGGIALGLTTLAITHLQPVLFVDPDMYPPHTALYREQITNVQVLLSLAIVPVFLWASWWQFQRLQPSEGWSTVSSPALTGREIKKGFSFFGARRPLRNLVLKELCLLKPIFFLVLLFLGLWLLAVLGAWWFPARKQMFAFFVDGCCMFYAPVALLLSGCISLCEEKKLGIHGINLISPASISAQWLVKNVIASVTGLLVTYGLLAVLTQLSHGVLDAEAIRTTILQWSSAYAVILFLMIQCTFWASTVLPHTVHATILGVGAGAVFYAIISAAGLCGLLIPLELSFPRVVEVFMSWFQIPFSSIGFHQGKIIIWLHLVAFIPVLLASYLCFRRTQTVKQHLLLSARVIVPSMILLSMASGMFLQSLSDESWARSSLVQETQTAFIKLKANVVHAGVERHVEFAYEQLLATGELSDGTARWLRGRTFTVSHYPMGQHTTVRLSIHSPKGSDHLYLPSVTVSPPTPASTSPSR